MKHAVYTGTRNLYGDMATAAKSLIANSDVDKVWLFVDDDTFDYWLPDICEVVDVSGQTYFAADGPNMNSQYTYMALMRSALALMPEFEGVDRILSLDVDTIACRKVSDVWDLPLNGCYFAASEEYQKSKNGMLYTNTGVALFNLAKLRDGKADEIIDVLNRRYFRWPEQDVMNYLCQGRILDMPHEYNACACVRHSYVRIRHYAAEKIEEWRKDKLACQYREMSWDRALELHEGQVAKRG